MRKTQLSNLKILHDSEVTSQQLCAGSTMSRNKFEIPEFPRCKLLHNRVLLFLHVFHVVLPIRFDVGIQRIWEAGTQKRTEQCNHTAHVLFGSVWRCE